MREPASSSVQVEATGFIGARGLRWPPMEQPLPGARESLAGHDFHMLWAMSLCLQMLAPESRLQRIVIESVAPIDRSGASRRAFLAADVTEYYAGDDFETAERVVLSQLKYSQRTPSSNWRASDLAPKSMPARKSIIGKLAHAYSNSHA